MLTLYADRMRLTPKKPTMNSHDTGCESLRKKTYLTHVVGNIRNPEKLNLTRWPENRHPRPDYPCRSSDCLGHVTNPLTTLARSWVIIIRWLIGPGQHGSVENNWSKVCGGGFGRWLWALGFSYIARRSRRVLGTASFVSPILSEGSQRKRSRWNYRCKM